MKYNNPKIIKAAKKIKLKKEGFAFSLTFNQKTSNDATMQISS